MYWIDRACLFSHLNPLIAFVSDTHGWLVFEFAFGICRIQSYRYFIAFLSLLSHDNLVVEDKGD